tara:strand:- start:6537 stop:7538 length:1002 start_codon:yes stop_codon:yes gene_type:complete
MKITKFELEKIIKEEIQDLQEIDFLKKIFGKSKDTNDTDDDFGAEEKQTKKMLTPPQAGPVKLKYPIDYCRKLSRDALEGDTKHPQYAKFMKRCQELSQNRDPDFIARLQGEETAEWAPGSSMPFGEFQRQHGSLEQFSSKPVKAVEHVLDMEFEGVAGYKDSAARYDEYISGESSFRRDKGTSIKSSRFAADNLSLPGGGYSQQALDQYGAMQEKITKSQLKQIILEELDSTLTEINEEQAYYEMLAEGETIEEAMYRGRKVKLNKPMRGDVKKSKVYVKNAKGNVVKVNFGDKKMKIKKSNPKRRKSFRARHNCKNPGPKWKARYWSCKAW